MNVRRIATASRVILAAQKNGITLAATLAMALESEQLLQAPEAAAEVARLRVERERYRLAWHRARTRALSAGGAADRYAARAGELQDALQESVFACLALQAAGGKEKDTAAPAAATSTPGTVLVAVARALREQPTGAQLLEGLDELGELSVCDGEPGEIASWVAALCHLVHLDDVPAAPTVVYRVEHGSIVAGLYTTAAAAQQHCEVLVSREYPADVTVVFDWLADEEDSALAVAELVVQVDGGDEVTTGYTVTPLEVAAAYDPDADE